MITIELKDDAVSLGLAELEGLLSDLTPVMLDIAEYLVKSTKDRFAAGTSPEGVKWAPKSATTLARAPGKTRPLFGESNTLNTNIFPSHGADFAEVGSTPVYAAMMQFGGTKSAFPHLWGNIPARPFLGASDDDRTAVLEIIAEHLTDAATP